MEKDHIDDNRKAGMVFNNNEVIIVNWVIVGLDVEMLLVIKVDLEEEIVKNIFEIHQVVAKEDDVVLVKIIKIDLFNHLYVLVKVIVD